VKLFFAFLDRFKINAYCMPCSGKRLIFFDPLLLFEVRYQCLLVTGLFSLSKFNILFSFYRCLAITLLSISYKHKKTSFLSEARFA